jgi:hypothetical protein
MASMPCRFHTKCRVIFGALHNEYVYQTNRIKSNQTGLTLFDLVSVEGRKQRKQIKNQPLPTSASRSIVQNVSLQGFLGIALGSFKVDEKAADQEGKKRKQRRRVRSTVGI